ncbi:hypothetical protein N510_000647 [Firmicutes bacterium ASF500]|nr:hypothetical protein N510_000536 [Firmicutes bacterium ASF500]USF25735.1 hypothetical protein N510_000647 [Firmicutes bacterium ASF500]
MKKKILAKLLVLCMVVGMVPTMAVAATGTAGSITVNSATNGSVYVVKSDSSLVKIDGTYSTDGDTTIRLVPDSGYEVVWGDETSKTGSYYTYTVNDDTNVVYITENDTTILGGQVATVHPVFTKTSSSGGSSGGSSSSADKVTVGEPATSGGTTTVEVKVETKTSGTTTSATVSRKDMDKAVDSAVEAAAKAGTTPAIVVKVETGDKTTAVKVDLPAKSLKTLSEAEGATLSITSDVADVVLDSESTAALAEQAAGSTVTVSVKPATGLNNAQKEAAEGATVIDVSVTSGGKQITDFGGGVLSISVKYALPEGVSSGEVQVFYLTDGGALEAHETSYSGGKVTFTTTHLSKYVIGTKSMLGVSFEDVLFGQYYYDAVAWAAKNKITAGITATMFAPDKTCTRAEIVSFLWRAAGSPEPKSASNPFTDVDSGAYYYKAVMWAVEEGITAGTSETTFSPDKTCTRAEAMAFLHRSEGSPAASGVGSFTDVPADAYYTNAVAWAVKSEITAGTSETTFSPDKTCTRAEIVTFLYRDMAK